MPTKANGLLYADYARAMKARARFGAKKVRVYPDNSVEFTFFGDDEMDAAEGPTRPSAAPRPPAGPLPNDGVDLSPQDMGIVAEIVRGLLQRGGPVTTAQMRAAARRQGYVTGLVGEALEGPLKDEVEMTEPKVYVLKAPKAKHSW
jgi:hypothetical protein